MHKTKINTKMKQKSILMLLASCLLFPACSSDDDNEPKLSVDELTLYVGDSEQLTYGAECEWRSEQPLIADVDDNGNVTAFLVGETQVYANDDCCNVTVKGNYNTYATPCLNWGCSFSTVKNFMSGYTLEESDSESLVYSDGTGKFFYFYVFENGRLACSEVLTYSSKLTEVTKFLHERYVFVASDTLDGDPVALYLNVDADMIVALVTMADSGVIAVLYMPYDETARAVNGVEAEIVKRVEKARLHIAR